jgi:hypothetical protein
MHFYFPVTPMRGFLVPLGVVKGTPGGGPHSLKMPAMFSYLMHLLG